MQHRKVTAVSSRSTKFARSLKAAQRNTGTKGGKELMLIKYSQTRWSGEYLMMSRNYDLFAPVNTAIKAYLEGEVVEAADAQQQPEQVAEEVVDSDDDSDLSSSDDESDLELETGSDTEDGDDGSDDDGDDDDEDTFDGKSRTP